MIGMQYKIKLPSDYDMNIIKTKVRENGFKTDGFDDLLFKCYLIKEKGIDSFENMYAPLYIWADNGGMNKFLFDGYYDNIIRSFGWQQISIGIPILKELGDSFKESKFVVEISEKITPDETLTGFRASIPEPPKENENYTGRVCIYNPEKWCRTIFEFYKKNPAVENNTYQVLHISQQK